MTTTTQPLLVLVGPTGVGKTQVALELARTLHGELVGADSMQIYRGFDIGTAKPTAQELGEVRHHLIDVADAEDAFDAARYALLADAAIAEIAARAALPIVVGGTGLWLRALLRGLVDVPSVDVAVRAELARAWDEQGGVAMHMRLAQVDPVTAARVHANDKLRVVRALEVHAQTGQALGVLRERHALGEARYRELTIVLDLPDAHYRPGVRARTRSMIERGFAHEVATLIQKHGPDVRPLQAVGYKQMCEHLRDGVSIEGTQADIERATLVYARRQRTWWKSAPNLRLRMTPGEALQPSTIELITAHFDRRD